MLDTLLFILARLRHMSVLEACYRTRVLCQEQRARWLIGTVNVPAEVAAYDPADLSALSIPSLLRCGSHASPTLPSNSSRTAAAGSKDPKDSLPCEATGEEPGGDVRLLWESARLQQIVLGLLPMEGDPNPSKPQDSERTKDELLSWLHSNPVPRGINYASAMECALRIPVFFLSLKRLDNLDVPDRENLLLTIYRHACWIEKRLSLYSSLGNHTIAEAVGLVFAGALFRKSKVGRRWLKRGFVLLGQELDHQVLPDGGGAERSLHYLRFVLDLYWLAINFAEINSLQDCSALKPRLVQAEGFLAAFAYSDGSLPMIGDSDSGHAIAPGVAPARGEVPRGEGRLQQFPDTGYSVVRLGNGMMLTFDHGPLGMAPLYNHGHADALSITVRVADQDILVDSGTYRYNGVPQWRRYFKGTRAHNTITIDDADQAVQLTSFVWKDSYETALLRTQQDEKRILLEAEHNGYLSLKRPVMHRRTILCRENSCVFVKDTFVGRGHHDYELNFHFHPEVMLVQRDGWWHAEKGGDMLSIMLLGSGDFAYLFGQETPIAGWYSASYGMKQRCPVLRSRKNGPPSGVSFVTVICAEEPPPLDELGRLAETL